MRGKIKVSFGVRLNLANRITNFNIMSHSPASEKHLKRVPSQAHINLFRVGYLEDRRLFAPFIAGFTDGDGFLRDSTSAREIVLASTSHKLLIQIQAMLADSGIHARLSALSIKYRADGTSKLPSYTLTLTGEQASHFGRLVCDHLKIAKKRAIAIRLKSWQERVLNTAAQCIPSKSIFAELSRHHIGGG